MYNARQTLFLLIVIVLLNGCATRGSIERNYASIEYSNGIDKKEAVLIAKHYLINTNDCYAYRVIAPWVEDWGERNAWIVWFSPKRINLIFPQTFLDLFIPKRYSVVVDKETGQIRKEETGIFRGRMAPVSENGGGNRR